MHQSYWGLLRDPFSTQPAWDDHYASEAGEEALLRLRYVVEQARGAGLLVGETGVGKSHLLQVLAQQLDPRRHPVIALRFPQLNAAETLQYLASELSGDSERPVTRTTGLDGAVRAIERSLDLLAGEGISPVIAVEDSHLIEDPGDFQVLRLVLDLQPLGGTPPTLLLVGEPAVRNQVGRIAPLADRIAVHCELSPFEPHETDRYVQHRLAAAGAGEEIFTPAALSAVHRHSGGAARRINRLCDLGLLLGFAAEADMVDVRQIESAAEECAVTYRRRAA